MIPIILLFVCAVAHTQNIEDAYKDRDSSEVIWNDIPDEGYDGEYQIFLDKFFWNSLNGGGNGNPLNSSAISFSIEVVSFPFIPVGDLSSLEGTTPREFNTAVADDSDFYGHIESYENNPPVGPPIYSGLGWEYDGFKIYQKLDNINSCDDNQNMMCSGHYGLVSQAYSSNLFPGPDYEEYCHLPHTILKHTLYFHDSVNISGTVIDSISWLYDNTRGKMNDYPFEQNDQRPPTLNIPCDVIFRPTFNHYFISWGDYGIVYYPAWTSNSLNGYYDSGLIDSTGSINYYPADEAFESPGASNYPFYIEEGDTGGYFVSLHNENHFKSDYVHPPPFALMDAPLLNYFGTRYAGYYGNGSEISGYPHEYRIEVAFDLGIINPDEKIIYNPSEVTIKCDLTFPCGYKFLTLHGKYPDNLLEVHSGDYSSQYWDQNTYFDFKYDREYPIPVNCTTNEKCSSTYFLDECVLTIEPYVIIMDAYFEGTNPSKKSIIRCNPNLVYGNWRYDPNTIILLPHIIGYPDCIPSHESGGKKIEVYNRIPKNEENNLLKILNGGTVNPSIQVNIEQPFNIYIKIYNSFGYVILEKEVKHYGQTFSCSDLKGGVYHTALLCNGKIIQRKSFSKM